MTCAYICIAHGDFFFFSRTPSAPSPCMARVWRFSNSWNVAPHNVSLGNNLACLTATETIVHVIGTSIPFMLIFIIGGGKREGEQGGGGQDGAKSEVRNRKVIIHTGLVIFSGRSENMT